MFLPSNFTWRYLPTCFPSLLRLLTKLLVGFVLGFLVCTSVFVFAQNTVVLAPYPKLQFFDQSGTPLAFGCVFTYRSGTTTPLQTYTDYTGVTQNANPVILSAGGSANIWLLAGNAYTMKVVSFGGSNCAAGTQQYSISGIGGGTTLNTTNVAYSATPTFTIVAQNQLFEITLTGNASALPLTAVGILSPAYVTFQITQDNVGGHTFSWPANTLGGAPISLTANSVTEQMFVWNGITATAIGPAIIGPGPAISTGNISATGTITATSNIIGLGNLSITGTGLFGGAVTLPTLISATVNPASSGTVRLANADSILWRNAGNSGDEGFFTDGSDHLIVTQAAGMMLTGAVPNIFFVAANAAHPMIKPVSTGLEVRLGDDSADANLTASTLSYGGPSGPTFSGACTTGQIETATSSTAVSCQTFESVASSSLTTNIGTAIAAGATTWITKSVTMPSTGCPCRAFVSYGVFYSASSGSGIGTFWVEDGVSQFATNQNQTATSGGNAPGVSASSFSPNTYGNSASVTFTGKGYVSPSNITVGGAAFGSSQNSWLNVAIFTSN